MLALVAWQGWMVMALFGFECALDDRPLIEGYHPQHLYLGWLGAAALKTTGKCCCYDPAFQIGYPKTPVFNGSRLAEVFLYAAGGNYDPTAYKVGLAALFFVAPFLMVLAARGVGMCWCSTFWATALGLVIWWSPYSLESLRNGTGELLIGALAVLANMGLLLRYHRMPGFFSWLGIVLTAGLSWFFQPTLFPIALPLLLVYYLNVGHHHTSMLWHFCLLFAEVLALVLNASWIVDWVTYWWLRSPSLLAGDILRHRTLGAIWNAPFWGGPAYRALALVLVVSAAAGVTLYNRGSQRAAARVLGLGFMGMMILAVLGISWEPMGALGTKGLLAPALWFAALPAAHLWTLAFAQLRGWARSSWPPLLGLLGCAGLLVALFPSQASGLRETLFEPAPLETGVGPMREVLADTLTSYTNSGARILWEDVRLPGNASRWTALLPVLTERSFVGGLDPDVSIEHSTIGLVHQCLEGTPIGAWKDKDLEEYCRRYNIGWIVCWSTQANKRISEWRDAEKTAELLDAGPGYLYTIKRARPSYTLKGQADLVHASSHHIALANVVPDNGVVVLSLHYQKGMRAYPSRVQVEREPSSKDPIGLVRLRLGGTAARVTLTWGDP